MENNLPSPEEFALCDFDFEPVLVNPLFLTALLLFSEFKSKSFSELSTCVDKWTLVNYSAADEAIAKEFNGNPPKVVRQEQSGLTQLLVALIRRLETHYFCDLQNRFKVHFKEERGQPQRCPSPSENLDATVTSVLQSIDRKLLISKLHLSETMPSDDTLDKMIFVAYMKISPDKEEARKRTAGSLLRDFSVEALEAIKTEMRQKLENAQHW